MMQDYQHELGQIRELLKKNPEGMSVTDLSKALGKNKNTVADTWTSCSSPAKWT